MKVEYSLRDNILKFQFISEEDDPLKYRNAKMVKNTCEFKLPIDWNINMVHPDVLALSIILIIYPFTGRKIILPIGVSIQFHDYFKYNTKKEVLPINYDLAPRKVQQNAIPALAYSGGVDSTAALALLPNTTVSIFLDRIIPNNANTLYNKEAAHFACKSLKELGRSVYMIETDLEYVREPVGFPVDVANTVPALLLSDYIGLDSIAFGLTSTYAYPIFNPKFQEYTSRLHYKRWGKLFEIVGMPFNLVTVGITEIGTTKIVMNSPYYSFTQSCMRGKAKQPCMNCYKCFRKKLIELVLQKRQLKDELLDKWFKIGEVKKVLLKLTPKHELIFMYITAHYNGNNKLMNLLKKRTRGDVVDANWLEKWYEPSLELVCEKYREHVRNKILKYFEIMNETDEQNMKSLNADEVLPSLEYVINRENFEKALIALSQNEINKL